MTTTRTMIAVVVAFAAGVSLTSVVTGTLAGDATKVSMGELRHFGTDGGPSGTTVHPAAKPVRLAHVSTDAEHGVASLTDLALTDDECTWVRKSLVAERERRVNAVIRPEDTGIDIMERYLDHGADVEPVVSSFDAAAKHVRRGDPATQKFEATGDVATVELSGVAPGTTAIEFGPGRFVVGGSAWGNRRDHSDAIEIRGAGKDRTTLVMSRSFLYCDGSTDLRNVAIRDLTIDSTDSVLDVRGGNSAVCEGVRFTGTRSGGYSSALGVSGRAFLACRDCEFLGVGDGFALNIRGTGVAVFERCTFSDLRSAFMGQGAATGGRPSVVRVIDSLFRIAPVVEGPTRQGPVVEIDLRVRGATVQLLPSRAKDEERRKAWGADFAASVEGATYAAAVPRFSFADALRALDLATTAGISDVVTMEVFPQLRGTPAEIEFYVLDRATGVITRRTKVLAGDLLAEPRDTTRSGRMGLSGAKAADLDGMLPLADLVRRAAFMPDEQFTGVGCSIRTNSNSPANAPTTTTVVTVRSAWGHDVCLDSRTGEVVH